MNSPKPTRPAPHRSEAGFMMVAVMFLLAALVITLSLAVPRIAASIQRDRDVETMHRGKQYIRAIQLYYRKFHAYPPNMDALVKTQEIRFLRKKYIDPTTGKDEWKPIQFGQNKVPTAWGFFGQPMGGSSIAGTGPGGGNGLNNGLNNGQQPGSGGLFNTPNTDPNSGQPGQNPGQTPGQDPNSPNGNNGTGINGNGPGTGFGGQTFGGAGIIGFSPMSPKQSILVYHKKNHYNEWEFVYDPLNEQQVMGGGGLNPNQPVGGGPQAPGFGGQPGLGGQNGLGSQNGIFNPTQPTQPTQPDQPTQPVQPQPQQ